MYCIKENDDFLISFPQTTLNDDALKSNILRNKVFWWLDYGTIKGYSSNVLILPIIRNYLTVSVFWYPQKVFFRKFEDPLMVKLVIFKRKGVINMIKSIKFQE